ncbi:acetoacetyl-CoA reductase [Marinobacteraceae bacterium S3BR75-40.1]
MERQQVAVVTGGTGGIGTAMCRQLNDAGYQVAACYCSGGPTSEKAAQWKEAQAKDGYQFHTFYVDVSDFESCQRCVLDIEETLGPISVLVNNAGITRDTTLKKMDVDQWQDVIRTNLDGVFNMTRPTINGMLERQYGRVINIASINGQKGQFGQANYSAAKAGIHGFTKAVAQEVARKGVTVNTISPGYVDTAMIQAVPDEIREQIRQGIPVGRFGQPEDIARTVVFLADEKASYITGADFSINGGQYMH